MSPTITQPTKLSRRAAITAGLVMSTAAAVPIVAAAAVDPIFAAIEEHRRAFGAFEAACRALDRLRHDLPQDVTKEAQISLPCHLGPPITFGSHGEIDEEIDGRIRAWTRKPNGREPTAEERRAYAEKNEALRRRLHAEFDAEEAARRSARDAVGLTKFEANHEAADNAEAAAWSDFLNAEPATRAGALAKLAYMRERIEGDRFLDVNNEEWLPFLASIERAIAA